MQYGNSRGDYATRESKRKQADVCRPLRAVEARHPSRVHVLNCSKPPHNLRYIAYSSIRKLFVAEYVEMVLEREAARWDSRGGTAGGPITKAKKKRKQKTVDKPPNSRNIREHQGTSGKIRGGPMIGELGILGLQKPCFGGLGTPQKPFFSTFFFADQVDDIHGKCVEISKNMFKSKIPDLHASLGGGHDRGTPS